MATDRNRWVNTRSAPDREENMTQCYEVGYDPTLALPLFKDSVGIPSVEGVFKLGLDVEQFTAYYGSRLDGVPSLALSTQYYLPIEWLLSCCNCGDHCKSVKGGYFGTTDAGVHCTGLLCDFCAEGVYASRPKEYIRNWDVKVYEFEEWIESSIPAADSFPTLPISETLIDRYTQDPSACRDMIRRLSSLVDKYANVLAAGHVQLIKSERARLRTLKRVIS